MIEPIYLYGPIPVYAYLYADEQTGHAFLIDPGAQPDLLQTLILERGITLDSILLTHGHFDHIGAVQELQKRFGVPVYAHRNSPLYLQNPEWNLSQDFPPRIRLENVRVLDEGASLSLPMPSRLHLEVIHTPGHTTDSVLYYDRQAGLAFVGDTIFKGSFGNYTFPGGNLSQLLSSIRKKILTLPPDTVLYSGHSAPTTVRAEAPYYENGGLSAYD
ncbi:MAG: MBL fold metallo-hydrolase [Clostridia bacterium]|nr:MBL fold metallo-hydrolase [Clostridia bacterium]